MDEPEGCYVKKNTPGPENKCHMISLSIVEAKTVDLKEDSES